MLYPNLCEAYRLKEMFLDIFQTNASTEAKYDLEIGINSKIQLAKWRARGFRNIKNFINMIRVIYGKVKFLRVLQYRYILLFCIF